MKKKLKDGNFGLSKLLDHYVFDRIFIFGMFNFIIWILGCVFCTPFFGVLFQLWFLAWAFDYSIVFGLFCFVFCCLGGSKANKAATNFKS